MTAIAVASDQNNTVLAIVQAFCRTYGLPVPSGLKGSSDAGALQLKSLLQEVGDFVVDYCAWEWAERKASWTSVASQSQGPLFSLFPDDMLSIIPDTLWNETDHIQIKGPVSPQQRQEYSAGLLAPCAKFWISKRELIMYPAPKAGKTMSLLYRSNHWIVRSDGVTASFLDADTDRPLPSRRLMSAGLAFFWKRIKELPYAVEEARFMDLLADEASRNVVRGAVSLDSDSSYRGPGIVIPTIL